MNEELQKLYDRARVLEYGHTKIGKSINYLYEAATNEITPHLEGYDIKTKLDAERHLEEECNVVIFDRRSKIDTLRQKYELVDKVATGKTSFSKEWEQYRIRTTGVIRMSLRQPKVEKAKAEFLPGFNECAKYLLEKPIDLEEYRKKRIKASSILGATEAGASYISSLLYLIEPHAAIGHILGTLVVVFSVELDTFYYGDDLIWPVDNKMKAIYDLTS